MAEMTTIAAINLAITEEMEADSNVFCIGEDIKEMGGTFGITRGLYEKFPGRVINTPISEAAPASMCVGAALYGKRPIMEIMFADFLSITFDSIVNQASKMRYMSHGQATVPVVFRSPQGVGGGIGAHHSQTVDAWFLNAPGLKIVTPSTPQDAYGLMKSSIRDNNPVLFLEHKALYRVPGEVVPGECIPLSKANVVKPGKDITIVSNQFMLAQVGKLLPELASEGIDVELIDPRTLKPFDYETVYQSVAKTGRILFVSEGPITGNWTADVAAKVAENCFHHLKAPIRRLGAVDSPLPYARAEFFMVPNTQQIKQAITELVK
ncbi:MAG: alpha-ketoacid dehydrogenase subunit beta [Oscillospiraceae bacterium]|jgi:pyruvate/2-oxoglutarate/acetoin dehydrogenase E1 component